MDQVSLELVIPSIEAFLQPVCRVCLATDLKMFDLLAKELIQDFFHLTGLQLSISDGSQYCICYICCALLRKATSFRNKCLSAHKLLSNHVVTLDFMKQKKHLLPCKPLKRTEIFSQNFIGSDSDIRHIEEAKEEIPPKSENCLDIDQPDGLSSMDKAANTNKDITSNEHINSVTGYKKSRAKTLESNTKKCNNIKMENSNPTNVSLPPSFNSTKGMKNIFKYTDVFKHRDLLEKHELTDSDDDCKPLSNYTKTVKTEGKTGNESKIGEENNTASVKINKREEYEAKLKRSRDSVRRKRKKRGQNSYAMRTKAATEKFEKTYNCRVVTLSKEEQVDAVKTRAESNKYKKGTYKCEDCYTGFANESKFIAHRKTHDPAISGSLECEVCHMRFQNKLQYTRHATNHTYKYICGECDFVCYDRSIAKNHFESHAGVLYECQYCKQVFSKYASRTNHARIQHGSARCDVCYGRVSAGAAALALHRAHAHKQTYKCSTCERVFNDPEALRRHLKSPDRDVCDTSLRPCTRCGECFNMEDEDLFNNHTEIHAAIKKKKITKHEDTDNIPKESEKARDSQFGSRRRGRTTLMCEICAMDNFKSITALRIHQRIHSGEKPFHCPSCPKTFRLKHTLQWHIRTHTGERPYACAECPKAFKTNTARARHRLVHTNERRHICELCGKAFQTSTNMKLHVRTVHMKIPTPPRVRNRKKRNEADILLYCVEKD